MRFNQLTVRRVTANHSVISIDLDGLYVEECIALLRRVESSSGGGRDREHPYLPDLRQQNQSGNHRQPIGAYAVDGGIIYERHEDNPPPNVPPTPPNVPNYLWINIIANVLTPSQVRQRVARIPRPEVGWRYVTVVYLNVEWGEQTEVKSMGAIWCGSVKKWTIPWLRDVTPFRKYIPYNMIPSIERFRFRCTDIFLRQNGMQVPRMPPNNQPNELIDLTGDVQPPEVAPTVNVPNNAEPNGAVAQAMNASASPAMGAQVAAVSTPATTANATATAASASASVMPATLDATPATNDVTTASPVTAIVTPRKANIPLAASKDGPAAGLTGEEAYENSFTTSDEEMANLDLSNLNVKVPAPQVLKTPEDERKLPEHSKTPPDNQAITSNKERETTASEPTAQGNKKTKGAPKEPYQGETNKRSDDAGAQRCLARATKCQDPDLLNRSLFAPSKTDSSESEQDDYEDNSWCDLSSKSSASSASWNPEQDEGSSNEGTSKSESSKSDSTSFKSESDSDSDRSKVNSDNEWDFSKEFAYTDKCNAFDDDFDEDEYDSTEGSNIESEEHYKPRDRPAGKRKIKIPESILNHRVPKSVVESYERALKKGKVKPAPTKMACSKEPMKKKQKQKQVSLEECQAYHVRK